jgi:hypothetical protein
MMPAVDAAINPISARSIDQPQIAVISASNCFIGERPFSRERLGLQRAHGGVTINRAQRSRDDVLFQRIQNPQLAGASPARAVRGRSARSPPMIRASPAARAAIAVGRVQRSSVLNRRSDCSSRPAISALRRIAPRLSTFG